MIRLELTRQSRSALGQLQRNYSREVVYNALTRIFDVQAQRVAGRIIRDFLSGQRLKRRSGDLARSVVGRGELIGGVPGLRVGVFRGPALKYAGVQELGTKGKNPDSPFPTIKPKNAQALAIPVGPAVTPAGLPRYDGPLDFPDDLVFIPKLRGRVVGLLAVPRGEGQIETAYILMSAVDIAPKFYLRDGMLESLPEIALAMEKALVDIVAGRRSIAA